MSSSRFLNMPWSTPEIGNSKSQEILRFPEGIPLKTSYSQKDLKFSHLKETLPGLKPFIRGPYA